MENSVSLWVTLAGIIVPLLTIAGSVVAYVIKLYLDSAEKKRNQFFELMQFLDSDRPLATKVAAIYELRKYPEHRDFIVRFCDNLSQNVEGKGAKALVDEMKATGEFMASQQSST